MKYTTLSDFKYRFVRALVSRGKATSDDGRPDARYRFRTGECKAVGPWVRKLADRGYIAECGRPTSKAQSRHNGLTRRWRAVDRGYLTGLLDTLAEIAKPQAGLFGEEGANHA